MINRQRYYDSPENNQCAGRYYLLKDAIVYMSEHSNSRYPVYHEDIDNIVGFIHIKDAMEHQNRQNMKPKA